jgi:hypothetical protein
VTDANGGPAGKGPLSVSTAQIAVLSYSRDNDTLPRKSARRKNYGSANQAGRDTQDKQAGVLHLKHPGIIGRLEPAQRPEQSIIDDLVKPDGEVIPDTGHDNSNSPFGEGKPKRN